MMASTHLALAFWALCPIIINYKFNNLSLASFGMNTSRLFQKKVKQ